MISPRRYFTSLLAVHIDSAAIVSDIAVIVALELFTVLLVFYIMGESHSNLAHRRVTCIQTMHMLAWRVHYVVSGPLVSWHGDVHYGGVHILVAKPDIVRAGGSKAYVLLPSGCLLSCDIFD